MPSSVTDEATLTSVWTGVGEGVGAGEDAARGVAEVAAGEPAVGAVVVKVVFGAEQVAREGVEAAERGMVRRRRRSQTGDM